MRDRSLVWVVEVYDDFKDRWEPCTVHRTMSLARVELRKRRALFAVRLQSYLRADI